MDRKGYVAIVESRTVPETVLELMIRLGRTHTDHGWAVSSGDAYDSDRAGWYGAVQSKHYDTVGSRIYLASGTGRNWYRIRDHKNFMDATQFTDTWADARAMAITARGSFGGLNEFCQALHTRNVYQIHGHTLDELVERLFYYAKPIGKRENERVDGGTNTALRLSVMAGVPIRKNLYFEDDRQWCLDWLAENELDYPYQEIDWNAIHNPRDPRVLDF
ncbi:DprA-like DNA recombination-mediator protein [Pseudomonas phage PhiPA3]|uniref:Uncharacterized protein 249 n=1 Tax=Pseudomonas phage PhiPA3 TaxID=998086 RepID=F8SJ91_BPPA3|nr:DprA-like DNA recombination-mediator protein [Pseudomonas phage PhiPA3]AEH03672.1 hypothetical protein [Pseudomonas phage PhiPA3]